jgi:hypothetical protein
MSQEIKNQIAEFYPDLKLDTLAKWREGDQFKFRLSLSSDKTEQTMRLDYSGGCLAFLPDTGPGNMARKALANPRKATEESLNAALAASRVTLADVLYSLTMDASGADQSFPDWASEYGYDSDSRAALSTYEKVQEQTRDFLRVLGKDRLNGLADILADY